MRLRDPKRWIDMLCTAGILCLLWGGTVCVLSLPLLAKRIAFISSASTSVGRSIDTRSYTLYKTVLGEFVKQQVYIPIVEFSAGNGQKYRFISVSKFSSMPDKVTFPVYYRPAAPEIFIEKTFSATLLFPLSFFAAGAALMLCGLGLLTKALNMATRISRVPRRTDFLNAPETMFMQTRRTK
ncbi:MAG: hypothetical protein PHW69_02945 [Elusimicrobiaceae bacterium]|nr:hypothetical protein [Elusimicrobiaceae bacterium]